MIRRNAIIKTIEGGIHLGMHSRIQQCRVIKCQPHIIRDRRNIHTTQRTQLRCIGQLQKIEHSITAQRLGMDGSGEDQAGYEEAELQGTKIQREDDRGQMTDDREPPPTSP